MKRNIDYYSFIAKYWDIIYEDLPYENAAFFIDEWCSELGLDKDLLDVACGTGLLLEELKILGYKILGSDINEAMLRQAKQRLSSDILRQANYRTFDYKGKFSIIVSFFNSFGYHLTTNELYQTLTHLKQFLKQNGLLIFDIYTNDNPETIYMTSDYNSDDIYLVKTFRGIPNMGVFESTYFFTVLDKKTLESEMVEAFTKRGLFTTEEVISTINQAEYELLEVSGEPMYQTFVIQNK